MKNQTIKTISSGVVLVMLLSNCFCQTDQQQPRFISVSEKNNAYFAFSDGSPYIPIGINLINPSHSSENDPASSLQEIEGWMKNLSANGGNYVRIWLSQSFWDMEDKQAGVYSDEKIKRIDWFISTARKYNLRIKITLEHFRSITLAENNQPWATKFVYHTSKGGPLDSVRQYLSTLKGRKLFLDKLDFYQKHLGSDTLFFGWELWNEMNALHGPQDSIFFDWNKMMLKEVKQRFPQNLIMQSLGSFDNEKVRELYKKMMLLPGNEVAQVHRYLDLGAPMPVCQASMDIICSSAIEELRSYRTGKPVLLAETGAVEPKHAGPSKYYPVDTAGILLHDILFAPFFSGAAGTGMSWHWESYVAKNNLWYHFARFNEAIKGINPLEENFVPLKSTSENLRIYMLKGNKSSLLWVRDTASNWQSELETKVPARTVHAASIDLRTLGIKSRATVELYDPWKNEWTSTKPRKGRLVLPDFKRSIVVRVKAD